MAVCIDMYEYIIVCVCMQCVSYGCTSIFSFVYYCNFLVGNQINVKTNKYCVTITYHSLVEYK